jgi:hypothetical protein
MDISEYEVTSPSTKYIQINNYITIESKPLNDFALGIEVVSRDSWLGQDRDRISYLRKLREMPTRSLAQYRLRAQKTLTNNKGISNKKIHHKLFGS